MQAHDTIRRYRTAALILVSLGTLAWAQSESGQDHWVETWAASPQAVRVFAPRPRANAKGAPARPQPVTSFHDQTVRMIVRTSIGGSRIRVQLSNAFGAKPLVIGAAHVALHDKESMIAAGSDRTLKFSGQASFTIPPGALAISDPVDLDVPALGDLAVSLYFPEETGPVTMHATGLHTTYISKSGDVTSSEALKDTSTTESWYVLSGVDVMAPPEAEAIVAFGDSITDGATSTPDTNRSWPALLADRLHANRATAHLAVVNQGISGNQVLSDGAGVNALARYDRDVLAQDGVKWVMIMESINDIGIGYHGFGGGGPAAHPPTAGDLIAGLTQLVERAHMRGIKVIGCTLTPFEGAAYYSDKGEEVREAVNQWIRTGGAFDAVVDFDAITRDPDHPKQIRPSFNIRDHLHPNDDGYKAMADAIDLGLFAPKAAAASARR
jgi:lysophospholipase L1-like esterase